VPVGAGLASWTVERGEPLIVPRIADTERPLHVLPARSDHAYVGVPMHARGRVLGVLSVVDKLGQQFTDDDISLLSSIADQIGAAVENAQLYEQAEQFAVMRERQRLARELHDSVTQALYSLVLVSEAGRRLAGAGDLQRAEQALCRLGEIGQQALKEMRLLVYELRPLSLRREGLAKALQQRLEAVERRAGVEASLTVDDTLDLSASVEEELYRVVQEALNNSLKHAGASAVEVQVRTIGGIIQIDVSDNGRGFNPETLVDAGGLGLRSIRERVGMLGGTVAILSAPGQGTIVRAALDAKSLAGANDSDAATGDDGGL